MSELHVKMVHSGAGRPERQKQTLIALGLRKMGRVNVIKDSPAVRGMIRKVAHLVQVTEKGKK